MAECLEFSVNGTDDIYSELYKKLLDKRILYLNGDIDDTTVDYIATPILLKNIEEAGIPEDELKPLTIWLNSYGGSADVALYLTGIIQKSRIPINVKVLSVSASAGLYITLACKHRTATKNSIFLLHKGSYSLGGNANAVEDALDFYKGQVDEVLVDLIVNRTKITREELKKIRRNELYVLGEEALNTYGFIDELE